MENSARTLLDSFLTKNDDGVLQVDEAVSDAIEAPDPAHVSSSVATAVATPEPVTAMSDDIDAVMVETEMVETEMVKTAVIEAEATAEFDMADLANAELIEEMGAEETAMVEEELDPEEDVALVCSGEEVDVAVEAAEADEITDESVVPREPVADIVVETEGGRVWLSLPAGASISAVIAGLAPVELPAGVLWLSLGRRPATASEVKALCEAIGAAVSRPVAGVRCQRSGLADGIRQLAGVSVEFDGDEEKDSVDDGRPRVLSVGRTLRSGAAIRHRGDVLVYGDVNAGAEIVATGNIIVLGVLRGLAWAGSSGDQAAMIISLDLRPT
ncbi:MAG: septum site-determining protein MinC, partial [Myxococcota bacterium]